MKKRIPKQQAAVRLAAMTVEHIGYKDELSESDCEDLRDALIVAQHGDKLYTGIVTAVENILESTPAYFTFLDVRNKQEESMHREATEAISQLRAIIAEYRERWDW